MSHDPVPFPSLDPSLPDPDLRRDRRGPLLIVRVRLARLCSRLLALVVVALLLVR